MLSNQIIIYDLEMKTYQQLWQSITTLYEAGEAQAIVRTMLDVKYGMTLTDIICGKVNELSADEERKLEEIIRRLQKGEPVQYVLGEADFAGRTFHVEPGVLIPRPETAELCEWIKKDATENKGITEGEKEENTIRILDICTGSGCIAITLGLDIGGSEVTGWDISENALKIAQGNIALLDAGNVKIEYQDALKLAETSDTGRWNIIVSNPPYICEKEKADMEKNVLEHEPRIALFVPDEEPLKFYRAIAEYASSALKSGGALYFEINPIYEKETREMLEGLGFKAIDTKEDAILIGRVTDERDHSQLNVRDWSGKDPMRLVIDRHHPCFEGLDFSRGKTEVLQQIMQYLYNNKVQSLIVEGGAITHQAFLDAGLWDEIRVETLLSTSVENSVTSGTPAPMLPHNVRLISHEAYDGNVINTYERM